MNQNKSPSQLRIEKVTEKCLICSPSMEIKGVMNTKKQLIACSECDLKFKSEKGLNIHIHKSETLSTPYKEQFT